jgi:GNAT superfamily N-acetyltransferase
MLDDYGARLSDGVVWVIEAWSDITGIIVLLLRSDYLLLDNIAFDPARQGTGLGSRLLAFAEAEAVRRGYREIRPYTHRTMAQNQRDPARDDQQYPPVLKELRIPDALTLRQYATVAA